MKDGVNWFLLSVVFLIWSCGDDICSRVDCAESDVVLFSILDSIDGTDLVYDQNLIDPDSDLMVYYLDADQKVEIWARRHFGKIRFSPDYDASTKRYFLDVLQKTDTLDLHFILWEPTSGTHPCCPGPIYRIDSIFLNQTLFLPELPEYARGRLEILR